MIRRIVLLALALSTGFSSIIMAVNTPPRSSSAATDTPPPSPSSSGDSSPAKATTGFGKRLLTPIKNYCVTENAPRAAGHAALAWTSIAFWVLSKHHKTVEAAGLHVKQVEEWVAAYLSNEMTTSGSSMSKSAVVHRINDAIAAAQKVKSSALSSGVTTPLMFGIITCVSAFFAKKFGAPQDYNAQYFGAVVGGFTTLILTIIAAIRGGQVGGAIKELRALRDAVQADDNMMSFNGPSPSQERIRAALGKIGAIGNTGSTTAMQIVTVLGGLTMSWSQGKYGQTE